MLLLQVDPAGCLECLLIEHKFWLNYIKPETKRSSIQWKGLSSQVPHETKVSSSASEVIHPYVWIVNNIVFIEYLQDGRVINRLYHTNLLR